MSDKYLDLSGLGIVANQIKNIISMATCSTAAATAAKEIVIDNENWDLKIGSLILVTFSATNTASNPTFNVNNTGAKSVFLNTGVITTSSKDYAGTINRPSLYIYNGTYWVFLCWSKTDSNSTYSNASLGHGYGTCTTAEATTAKVVTLSSYAINTGGTVAVKFSYNVPANSTMNINSKGAKAIYYKGAAITDGIIKANDVAYFIYSTYYHLIGIDRNITDINGKQDIIDSQNKLSADLIDDTAATNKFLTQELLTKLNGIAEGAQVNVIETIKVNNVAQTVTSKAVNITVPTKTSDINNDSNFVSDSSYVHTDNNFTTTLKNKLDAIASGAQVNVIETIKVNNTALTPDANKAVNITVPTKTSDLTNDSGYGDVSTKQNKATYSTTDLTPGTSTLATGDIYLVYE